VVERPIKKSERQAMAETNAETNNAGEEVLETQGFAGGGSGNFLEQAQRSAGGSSDGVEQAQPTTIEGAQDSITPSPEERSTPRPRLEKDKSKEKGRGRGGQQKDDRSSRQPANPALMRGPRPTKPKPPVVQAAQAQAPDETAEDSDAAAPEEA